MSNPIRHARAREENRTIVIQVHRAAASAKHPEVKVNDETVDWDHLRERLRDIYAIRVERIAYVEDDDIDFQDVADVIAIARIAGVDRLGLLTEDGKHAPLTGQVSLMVHRITESVEQVLASQARRDCNAGPPRLMIRS